MKLSIKENSTNYVCTVVEIKDLFPIEGADKIQRCVVNGNDVVVSKDVKLGNKMLYFVSGTRLNEDYCKYNNLLDKAESNNDTTKKGFISYKQFRVKAIRLRGIVSDGMLMPLESLGFDGNAWDSDLKAGNEFTDINGISICEKYFVPCRNSNPGGKAPAKQPKISRLVENQFFLHNDTDNLRKNIHKFFYIIPFQIGYFPNCKNYIRNIFSINHFKPRI
jgi:tRNA-binding EMAP/Myf-like protein